MLGDIPVEVTLSPQARIAGSPEKLGPRTPFRAVLIGHDLARKGGEAFAAGVAEAARIAPVTGALVTGDRLGEVLAECYGLELITGVDSAAEVHRLFREADVSVLPTRRDRLPNVIAESIAAGTPVMAPPIGAIPELVIARRTGWLLPVNPDASDVASCLVQAATSDRMDAMRSTTLDFARAHLSWDVFVGKLATVMEAALR